MVKTNNAMNKKLASIFAVLIILIFIGYIIFDTASSGTKNSSVKPEENTETGQDKWIVSKTLNPGAGPLKAVTVSSSGNIFLGGDSWVGCFDKNLKLLWNLLTPRPVTSLSISGDTLYASTIETIMIISPQGEMKDEWGPYDKNMIITSVTSNRSLVAFADAGNKIVVILKKNGELKSITGKSDEPFIIPSPYFDVALATDNTLFVANTGNRRVEKRSSEGKLIGYFGLPGTAPDAFCGCCNPAHFVLTADGFITAEKGINRIKLLNNDGKFVEFVSSENKFMPSIPLDLASYDGKTIYAANPADGKLYVFERK
ncbi:MAG: hypothetical protein C0408_00470 [Odoribacter sp.]|nr:hypothetical protein [Odoribacter sp.]